MEISFIEALLVKQIFPEALDFCYEYGLEGEAAAERAFTLSCLCSKAFLFFDCL